MNPICQEEVFFSGSSGGALAGWQREGEGDGCVFPILGAKAGPPPVGGTAQLPGVTAGGKSK